MPTKRWSKWPLILITVSLLSVILYLSMRSQRMPECPHDWDFSKIQVYDTVTKEMVTLKTVNGSPLLSGPQLQTNVPEFNDCQRLIVGSGETARYDSLYAVFASSTYREARARARDSLDDLNNERIRTQMDSGVAVPMVEILSLGGDYPQLALKPGFSCLYVFKQGDTWSARLVGSGLIEQPCDSPKSVSEVRGHELSIKRTSALDMNVQWQDIPAVARWEWDVASNTQVIGFACLDGWCEAGELGHQPDTGPDLTGTMNGIAGLAGSPVLKVKGWSDEQRLSSTGHWWNRLWPEPQVPRGVVGTIVPVPGLDRFDSNDFAKIWKIIAYVNLSEPSQEYHDQQSFVPMASADSVTTISLCMEDWGTLNKPLDTGQGCAGISIELRKAAKSKCEPELTAPTIHWWAKTIPADNADPRYWCIVRRSTPANVPVPGTARWRWFADDETTWGRCGGACCSGH